MALVALAAGMCAAVASCNETPQELPGTSAAPAADPPAYTREFVFVGQREAAPVVVPLTFRAVVVSGELRRTATGSLVHEAAWDRFLDESWASPASSGVWRVLPRGGLRVAAGGPVEVESLWFRRGERSLRLDLGAPEYTWNQPAETRYRYMPATLTLGTEPIDGSVLEILRADPGGVGEVQAGEEFDWLFLSDGDSLRLVLAEALGGGNAAVRTFAWSLDENGERSWSAAEVRWLETRPLEEARRDVPVRWSFHIPDTDLSGEISALGHDFEVGEERGGRRTVRAEYSVEGWIERGGERVRVHGMVRHRQG